MDIEIKMPDLGTTEDEIESVRWLVAVGDPVALGADLVEVETDKAVMKVEAVAQGRLKEVRVAAGETAVTGQVIAVVEC
jgi:pyruvate/2-oxoglutarate dehydrogenase complex dihydrolipoamide acyltransferase (E2) component